jgi:hypothetical protein
VVQSDNATEPCRHRRAFPALSPSPLWRRQGCGPSRHRLSRLCRLPPLRRASQPRPRPRVRSYCRFRKRGTEYVSESGIKRMSGGAKRQCDRAPPRPRPQPGMHRVDPEPGLETRNDMTVQALCILQLTLCSLTNDTTLLPQVELPKVLKRNIEGSYRDFSVKILGQLANFGPTLWILPSPPPRAASRRWPAGNRARPAPAARAPSSMGCPGRKPFSLVKWGLNLVTFRDSDIST